MERVGGARVEGGARWGSVEVRRWERGGEGGWLAGPGMGSLGSLESLRLEEGLSGQGALVIGLVDAFVGCLRLI